MTQRNQPLGTAAGTEKPETRSPDSANLAGIEADINQTRNAISGDLRTLGERLSPDHLKQDAKELMGEAKNVAVETLHEAKNVATNTFRDVKNEAVGTVSAKVGELRENVRRAERETVSLLKENAVPLALIGIGVAWFVANRRTSERRWEGDYRLRGQGDWRYPNSDESHSYVDEARDGINRFAGGAREASARAKGRAGQWMDEAQHRVNDVAGQVRNFAERERDHVGSMARDAEQRLSASANRARDFAVREFDEVREFSRRTTETHPLAVGAAALAAGIGVGLLLPATRHEREVLGTRRDRLIDEARDAAQEWSQTARTAARGVKETLTGNPG